MRPTVAEIDLSAISNNIKAIKNKINSAQIMAVVKADAYGHGALKVSQTALNSGATYLGVGIIEEGIALRNAGIDAPILVLGGLFPHQASRFIKYNLEATIYDQEGFIALRDAALKSNQKARVHIKLDTGMGRVGCNWTTAVPFIEKVSQQDSLELVGAYTHFATADEVDKSFTYLQLTRFKQVIKQLEAKGISVPLKHTANSAGVLDIPESYFDLVRPGIMLYGYYPSSFTSKSVELEPAMTFKTRILYVKEINRGDSVGYNRAFIAKNNIRVATLPVGYADGYNRLLSDQARVLIHGKYFSTIGQVSMDLLTINLEQNDNIKAGDEVVLLGRQQDETIRVETISEKLNTIPYEVTCAVSKRVPRVYKHD